MDMSVLLFVSSNALLIAATCVIILVLVVLTESGADGKKSHQQRFTVWMDRVLDSFKVHSNQLQQQVCGTASAKASPPPGPTPYPIIGNLACLGGYEVPYEAFNDLGKQYGPIVGLRLGSVPTVVVNGVENIKEVLITKSSHFDSRPDFRRYHELFGGDKQNCKLNF